MKGGMQEEAKPREAHVLCVSAARLRAAVNLDGLLPKAETARWGPDDSSGGPTT